MKRLLLLMAACLLVYSQIFANLTQSQWRWRNNDGNEASATWKADQGSAITISDYKAIRLRMNVYNSTGDVKTMDHQLKYATSATGPWYTITDASAINAFILGGDNTLISQGQPTTSQMPEGTYTYVPGAVITRQDQLTDTFQSNTRREYEWCIKPTMNARRGVTYYFKSSAGDAHSPLPSLTVSGDAFTAPPAAILPNGGFENDLNGWTAATANGSTATFTPTQTPLEFHTGTKALAVNVTNAGPAGSVTLVTDPVTPRDTGVYLLRFWAIAKSRNALLDIELNSPSGNDSCHYQIYDRFDDTKNGWQMYQYAFRVTEGPVTLTMRFNSNTTYYLDDIELINDKTHPNIDVNAQYVWQNNFNESYGWLSGDNNNPVLLPDSSVAWVYNDSYMGTITPHSNVLSSGHIINNLVVKQTGDVLTSVYKGTAPNSQSLFSPGNGNIFWQSGGIIENGTLKVLLIEINNGNYAGHSWVGTLSLPDLQPIGLTRLPATIDVSPNCMMTDGAYNYIYFGQSTGTFEMHTIVARVPLGQFDSQTPWQYYQEDGSWSTDYTNAKSIASGVAAGNVLKLGENNYVMSGVPHLANEIAAWFAPTPYGPWTNKTIIYNIPEQEGILAYEGHLDPLSKDGYYTFTYSVYPFVTEDDGSSGSVPMQLAVKSTYLPIYARARLTELSPYTPGKSADSVLRFAGQMETNSVQLNWTSAHTTDDHYEVQRSPDGKNWTILSSVAGTDSVTLATYAATDPSPLKGINYYRLALYNLDHQLSYSQVIEVDNPAMRPIHLTSFTAAWQGMDKVRLRWTTATEQNGAGFTVERSQDNETFVALDHVSGAGGTSGTSRYTYYDESPLAGVSYYRLSYLSAGRELKSVVRVVQQPSAIQLLITPNPVQGKIRFILKGYTGDHFQAILTDITGKVIYQRAMHRSEGPLFSLPVRPASGIYVLQITGPDIKETKKLILP